MNHVLTEGQWTLILKEHVVDNLEDNLLHSRKVKVLHSHFCAVLGVDPQVNLLLVVVLHSKDEAKV